MIILDQEAFASKYGTRLHSLPFVEQCRLLNILKFINQGHKLTESVLAGFPKESIDLLRDMFTTDDTEK